MKNGRNTKEFTKYAPLPRFCDFKKYIIDERLICWCFRFGILQISFFSHNYLVSENGQLIGPKFQQNQTEIEKFQLY